MTQRTGFTLIETIAVIMIMGLLTGATVVAMAHTVDAHRYEAVCKQLEQTDGLVRSAARRCGKTQVLLFDLDKGQIGWQPPDESMTTQLFSGGRSCTIETLRTAEETFDGGINPIEISGSGYSQTYGLQLRQPDGSERWLIVAGITGQTRWIDDDKQVDQIFGTITAHSLHATADAAAPRDDAH